MRRAAYSPVREIGILLMLISVIAVGTLTLGGAASARAAASPRVAMILLDTNNSPGAPARLAAERRDALSYARALPADVEVGLIAFGGIWRTVLAPTANRAGLAAALTTIAVAGGTSDGLRGAVAGAAATLSRVGAGPGSRLVVLTDAESLIGPVQAVPVPVDVVLVYADGDDHPAVVRALARATGGRVVAPASAANLAAAFPRLPRPRPPGPRPAAQHAVTGWRPTAPLLAVLGLVFLALLVLALLAVRSLRTGPRRPRLAAQLERYGPLSTAPVVAGTANEDKQGRVAGAALGAMTRLLGPAQSEPKLALRLDRAGLVRKPAEWALLGVSVSAALAAVFTVVLGNVIIGLVLGIAAGWAGMRLALSIKISRRRAAFDDQLPNVLQLVAGSLQTGFSLAQALDAVVREDSQPASGEFARALAEARLGVDLDTALDSVATRLQSSDLSWVVMAIRIQRETGGNLAEILRTTVATMRERAYLRRQVRTLSAEGRLSAYVLLALPLVVGGWLFYSDPGYMRPLYTTFFGVAMLIVAAVLIVVGALFMRKIIHIEV
ncbi:MAG: type II secretion system F family protein [Streptosporangiaceae bacterium]